MTVLYYGFFHQSLPQSVFNQKLRFLSASQQEKIRKFRRWQDRHASLLGKLMLLKGFKEFGVDKTLEDVVLNEYGKPFLEGSELSFNISHAGHCAVCILSNDTTHIGIDIEQIVDVDISSFENICNPEEWKNINQSDLRLFYRFWTRKEAVTKAEGSGLYIPLNEIQVHAEYGRYYDKLYFLEEIGIDNDFIATVASLHRIDKIETFDVGEFDNL